MGSSGTGSFTDYPGSAPALTKGGGTAGGSSGEDRCDKAFETVLEDFEHSDFWRLRKALPKPGTTFTIQQSKRLVAVLSNGESIGSLPTSFNYLAQCMKGGHTYEGRVTASVPGAVARIRVDVAPQ
jgi:hypothetical protein